MTKNKAKEWINSSIWSKLEAAISCFIVRNEAKQNRKRKASAQRTRRRRRRRRKARAPTPTLPRSRRANNKGSDLLLHSSDDSNTAKVTAASGWKLEDAQKLGLFLDTLTNLDAETRSPVTEGVLVECDLKTVTDGFLAKSKCPSSTNNNVKVLSFRL